MDCPKCANNNPVHVLFCMRCGHELSHEVSEVRAAIRKEVVTEENEKLERRLREFLLLAVFVVAAAWAAGSYGSSVKSFAFSVFSEGPTVKIKSAPAPEMPLMTEVAMPSAKEPKLPDGASEARVIRLLKSKVEN